MKLNRLASRLFRGMIYSPMTLYINFRVLPFRKAIKFPFIIMGPCSVRGISRNNVILKGDIKTAMIKFATQKTLRRGLPVNRRAHLIIDDGGSITFCGSASIAAGTTICAHGGDIVLGNNFSCNINCFLYSMEYIRIGSDVLFGWNINVRDNDGHPIYIGSEVINENKGITLGNNIWVASYSDILKGVTLADGIIVATHSLVTKPILEEHVLIGGVPSKVIKEHVTWDYEFE